MSRRPSTSIPDPSPTSTPPPTTEADDTTTTTNDNESEQQKFVEKHTVKRSTKPWRLKLHLPHLRSISSRLSSTSQSPDRSERRRSSKGTPNRSPHRLDFTKNIPTNIPYPPFVNVEGVPNFRDVGGYACPAPSSLPHDADQSMPFSVRRGYVFRCSELSQISPIGSVALVEELGIRVLYDFRSEREAADPRGQPQGVHCISVPVFQRADITRQMIVDQLTWGTQPDETPDAGYSQGYVNWYRSILTYGAKSAYRRVFEHIRDQPDAPLLYHCTAGKDRTGVISAVILKLCGVDDETIAWEYSLTVPGMGVWEEAVEMEMVGDSMLLIRSHGGMTREEAKRVCGSRASNMAQFLKVVLEGEFGGAENYLKSQCGFTEEDVEVIKAHLVVPGEATVKVVPIPGYDEHSQT